MAEVWRARHATLRTDVAIKFATGELDNSFRARFEREALVLAQLGTRTRHVVRVTDFSADAVPYLVMELLDGEGLDTALRRRTRFAPAEVLWVVSQLVAGLSAIHGAGVVHRDIKPGNIFLSRIGDSDAPTVKLLDFGIAKATLGNELDAATREGTVLGTPQYMSPEQIVGDRTLDARADLWALGVVTYRMLVGQMPFEADADYVVAALAREPRLPSRLDASLPPGVDGWVARALAKSPADRFPTAESLLEALRLALDEPEPAAVALPPRARAVTEVEVATETEEEDVPLPLGAVGPTTVVEVEPRRRRRSVWAVSALGGLGILMAGWTLRSETSAATPSRVDVPTSQPPPVVEQPKDAAVPTSDATAAGTVNAERVAAPAPKKTTPESASPRPKTRRKRKAKRGPSAEDRARKSWGDLDAQ